MGASLCDATFTIVKMKSDKIHSLVTMITYIFSSVSKKFGNSNFEYVIVNISMCQNFYRLRCLLFIWLQVPLSAKQKEAIKAQLAKESAIRQRLSAVSLCFVFHCKHFFLFLGVFIDVFF